MKKILASLFIAIFAVSLVACGGGGSKGKTSNKPATGKYKITVIEKMNYGPWVLDTAKIGKRNGEKVMMFTGMGTGEDRKAAEETAILDAQTTAASAIRTIATKQVARAWERVGIPGRTEQGEQVTRGLQAAVSKNVNVSGLIPVNKGYRYVKKPGYERPFYEFYVQMAIPYQRYVELRDGVINKNKRKYRLNNRQKVLYNRTEKALKELNKMDKESNGGLPENESTIKLSPQQQRQRAQAAPGQ
jgi:hypothetical protein